MTVLRQSRRLAQAQGTALLTRSHVAAGWGYNGEGQLGDGTVTSRSGYGDIGVGDDVVQVAAGSGHGLALRSDGTVWAWGSNGAGELGDGTTTSRSTPVRVTGLSGVTQVAACGYFSVALRSDGTVWAWGDNRGGQLGRGTASNHEVTPARVRGLARVTKISAGGSFVLALRSDGSVRAWGDNRRGQLGNGTTASSPVPVKVAGLSSVTGISAGFDASIATRASGISAITSVWTWGGNDRGQLGNGSTAPVTGPVQVTGLTNATQVAAGGEFSLAVHVPLPPPIVPDLTGDTTARAGQALQAVGLVLGTVRNVVDNSCSNIGTVMSQNPLAGTRSAQVPRSRSRSERVLRIHAPDRPGRSDPVLEECPRGAPRLPMTWHAGIFIQVRGGSSAASRPVSAGHLWRLPRGWLSGRDTGGGQRWARGPAPPSG
jgi:hypothetical protein